MIKPTDSNTAGESTSPQTATTDNSPSRRDLRELHGFLSFHALCARVPLGPRTLREEIKRGRIPHIRLPGARRLLFDWDAVRASLLRYQSGGIQ